MAARMAEFQYITETQLPALYEEFDLDAGAREVLDGYVRELRDWLAGILNWHEGCRRYDGESLLRHFPEAAAAADAPVPGPGWTAPAGLGTSGARLAVLLGR
jgi:germacradienol/geosmin synthase